jgi:hypothetical protein
MALALLGSAPAHAEHCSADLIVLSGSGEGPNMNLGALTCVRGEGQAEPPFLTPGADGAVVRQVTDYGAGVTSMKTRVTGLGLDLQIDLTRKQIQTSLGSAWVYESPEFAIPPTSQGCLQAVLTHPVQLSGKKVRYRTVGGTC